jgi:hypothetical protein
LGTLLSSRCAFSRSHHNRVLSLRDSAAGTHPARRRRLHSFHGVGRLALRRRKRDAPTYLTFLANALGRIGLSIEHPAAVHQFLGSGKAEMVAISMGAVLFGGRDLHRQQSQFHNQGDRRATRNAHTKFYWFVTKFSLPILLPVLLLVYWLMVRG